MPTLVRIRGDEDFGRPKFSGHVDTDLFLSLAPRMEVLCPPRKRLRGNFIIPFRETKPKQEQKDLISMLPDECLFEIFRHLPAARDRSVSACVSKRWLMLQSSMRRSEIKRSKPSPKNCGETPNRDCSEQSKLCQENASFTENNFEEFSDDGFGEVEYLESESTEFDVGWKGTADKGTGEKQPRWAIGDLSRCLEGKRATDIRLAAISIGMGGRGGLGKLKIRGNHPSRGVSDLGLSTIGLGCPALRVLSLWDCPLISDKGLLAIAKGCHLLEKLDLFNCPLIGEKGLEAIAENCPGLLTLNIESCPKIGNKSLEAVGQHCPNLKSLSVSDCSLVGDQGIMSLVSSSTKLEKVKLQAVKVTNHTLAAIGLYCKNLTKLTFVNLQKVTEKGFQALGNSSVMQKLKLLSITCCRGLTDPGLESIGQGCLSARKCELLSDKGLKAFTKTAISLENLQLEECNMISHFGLIDALGSCSGKLKVLTLEKCTGIKESGLREVPVPTCESLKSLNIRSFPFLGNGCLALLGLCRHGTRCHGLGTLLDLDETRDTYGVRQAGYPCDQHMHSC